MPDADEGAANATEEDSPEKKARADTIARTAQLSIAQIMAGLADTLMRRPPSRTARRRTPRRSLRTPLPKSLGAV